MAVHQPAVSLPLRPSPQQTLKLTIHPHPGQHAIIKSQYPTAAAIAGTGSGKTVAGEIKLLLWMVAHPNELWLVVEPSWRMVDRILMSPSEGRPSLLQLIRYLDPAAIYVKSERAIYSKVGTVLLASATHPESMEGAHCRGAWLDEAGQMSKLAYETAVRRVSAKGGQVLITTTPYNRGWLFKDVYERGRGGDPDIQIVQFPSIANPTYDRQAFERNRRTMSAARFRMMHLGGFERPEGMIYSMWDDQHVVEPFPIPAEWWQGAALDFGYNHPFAGVFAARDGDGVYYLTKEYKKSEALLAAHHTALTNLNGLHPQVWYADPSAKQERAELRRLGLQTRPANNSVATGIDTVAQLIASGRLKVFNTLTYWLDEVEGYVWDTKHDLPIDRPVKVNDDLMDASRYLLHSAEKTQQPTLYT